MIRSQKKEIFRGNCYFADARLNSCIEVICASSMTFVLVAEFLFGLERDLMFLQTRSDFEFSY